MTTASRGREPSEEIMYHEFHFWFTAIAIVVVLGGVLGLCAYLILLERKIAAYTQDRLGPNRVGPWGLLQPIADGLKFLLKEDIVPSHVDKVFYLLAPAVAVSTAMVAIAVVPWGAPTDYQPPPSVPWPQTVAQESQLHTPEVRAEIERYDHRFHYMIAPHIDIGFLFAFAVGSLAVYGIILGGWSSNNKYSLLGALRSSAQIISYEIPMGMTVLGVVLMARSLNLETIIAKQVFVTGWNFLYQPMAFLLFLTAVYAECNRLPFDLPEAEQELVGGFHTEYSSMKFALFFLGEYAHLITTSLLVVVLFMGGWYIPWVVGPEAPAVLKVLSIGLKMMLFILLSMFIRWTLPRFRFDQLMGLAWKVFIPLALLNLLCVMTVQYLDFPLWLQGVVLFPVTLILLVIPVLVHLYGKKTGSRRRIIVWRGHEQVEVPAP
jgi:NADH-quinone oxidoreductase subunit H